MGACSSGPRDSVKDPAEKWHAGSKKQETVTKEDTTLWIYHQQEKPTTTQIKKGQQVKIIEDATKWWQVEHNGKKGYASKYNFCKKGAAGHEKELWYYGPLPRNEAVELLMNEVNNEGAFLIRFSNHVNKFVLTAKKYHENKSEFEIKHFDIFEKNNKFYINQGQSFESITGIVFHLRENFDEAIKVKLGDVCLIQKPHSDPAFRHEGQNVDTWLVPIEELQYDKENPLGKGNFGVVYKGTFQRTTEVAIKQLIQNQEGVTQSAVKEFIHEGEIMRKINHPNLVQLYAVVDDRKNGYFIVQEFVRNGDLFHRLGVLKNKPKGGEQWFGETTAQKLQWVVQVTRGMARLEKLGIVHRDLAARNILLDRFYQAKVADFGMSLGHTEEGSNDEKVNCTA